MCHVAMQPENRLETTPQKPNALMHLDESLQRAQACASIALDKKATDVSVLNVQAITSYADYIMICSAQSERQVQAIAHSIQDELKKHGVRPLHVEGLEQSNWILIDYGDVICHVLLESTRHYYNLDALWENAVQVSVG